MPRLTAFLAGLAVSSATADGGKRRPHILHVIVDDFGWGNTNYNREEPSPEVQTPKMDALVADGVHLMRHYVHAMCTPTRVSFQTGRLPMHSGQPSLCSPGKVDCGSPYNHTGIAAKLASVGYRTALVGKWDTGMATPTHTPKGRGYEDSLTYFGHGNYQWGQVEWGQGGGGTANRTVVPDAHDPQWIRDLWDNDGPAIALANRSRDEGVYEELIFRERIGAILDAHDPSTPLFLTYTARVAHMPMQAPIEYQQLPHIAAIDMDHRRVYHAMIAFLDDQLGNITDMFKAKDMWKDTLMVLSSDNGGYAKDPLGACSESDPIKGITCMTGEAGANNHPLRGGKYSFFEGGIRANSFVSGGFLPESARGTVQQGLMHIVDWYATYCGLAGVDPADSEGEAAGMPPVDSLNIWPLISGATDVSPREELFMNDNCLIQGDWKLITGSMDGGWPGPTYPNASTFGNAVSDHRQKCDPACLFNVGADGDMTEHEDLAASHPGRVQSMMARLEDLLQTKWTDKATPYAGSCQKLNDVVHSKYGGFYGPFCEIGAAQEQVLNLVV